MGRCLGFLDRLFVGWASLRATDRILRSASSVFILPSGEDTTDDLSVDVDTGGARWLMRRGYICCHERRMEGKQARHIG